jgi:poly(3-hydroxybutyrate) depolymerase
MQFLGVFRLRVYPAFSTRLISTPRAPAIMLTSILLRYVVATATVTASAMAASLTKVTNFGSNPTSIDMNIYVPDKVATKPAIIVAVCTIFPLFSYD